MREKQKSAHSYTEGCDNMANMNSIRDTLGNTVCRRCIAEKYGVDLQPADCKYGLYPEPCDVCKEIHNIVKGLTGSGKRKLLFK